MTTMFWYDEKADRYILHTFIHPETTTTHTYTRVQAVKLAEDIQKAQERALAYDKQLVLGEQHEHRISETTNG